jgi:hypothetical protein
MMAVLLLGFIVSACGPSEAELAATEAYKGAEEAQITRTMISRHTSEVATQQFLTQVANTQQIGTEQASTATQAFQGTRTSVSATQMKGVENTRIAITEQASNIYAIVQELYDSGYLTSTDGYFDQLPGAEVNWAQINWVRNYIIEDSYVADFVLMMDVSWESASRSAEFDRSGCGIAFRQADDYSEYYAFSLALSGYLKFIPRVNDAYFVYPTGAYWGDIDHMEGSTTLILTAQGNQFQVFNENLERIDLRYGEEIKNGYLAYQLLSGSNTDFGIRCNFTNT